MMGVTRQKMILLLFVLIPLVQLPQHQGVQAYSILEMTSEEIEVWESAWAQVGTEIGAFWRILTRQVLRRDQRKMKEGQRTRKMIKVPLPPALTHQAYYGAAVEALQQEMDGEDGKHSYGKNGGAASCKEIEGRNQREAVNKEKRGEGGEGWMYAEEEISEEMRRMMLDGVEGRTWRPIDDGKGPRLVEMEEEVSDSLLEKEEEIGGKSSGQRGLNWLLGRRGGAPGKRGGFLMARGVGAAASTSAAVGGGSKSSSFSSRYEDISCSFAFSLSSPSEILSFIVRVIGGTILLFTGIITLAYSYTAWVCRLDASVTEDADKLEDRAFRSNEGPPVIDPTINYWPIHQSLRGFLFNGAPKGKKMVRFSSWQTEDDGNGSKVKTVPFEAYEAMSYKEGMEECDEDEDEEDSEIEGEEEEEEEEGNLSNSDKMEESMEQKQRQEAKDEEDKEEGEGRRGSGSTTRRSSDSRNSLQKAVEEVERCKQKQQEEEEELERSRALMKRRKEQEQSWVWNGAAV